MLGLMIGLFPSIAPPVSVLGFFSRPKIELIIRLGSNILFSPSPPQVQHVEVLQTKCTREFPQLVQAKGFGKDMGSLPIHRNINQFDFIRKDTLADKMLVHLNVLGPGVEDMVSH